MKVKASAPTFRVGQTWESTRNGQRFKVVYVSPSGRFVRWTTPWFGGGLAEGRVLASYAAKFVRLVEEA